MALGVRPSLWPLICVGGVWWVGCGSSPNNAGAVSTPEGPPHPGTGGSATTDAEATPLEPAGRDDGATTGASADDATSFIPPPPPVGDGASPLLWIADAAPVRASDCKPGTYSGTFVLNVGFLGINSLTLMGNLSITLVANKPSAQFGEFNSGILTVAPGAMFSAKDNLGDVLFADIAGQLDCGSRMFVGTLSNGGYYVFGNDAASGMLDGTMSAPYDPGEAGPPTLGSGTFTFTSPQVPLTQGMGTWSAALQ
jgi:hypothetical protein